MEIYLYIDIVAAKQTKKKFILIIADIFQTSLVGCYFIIFSFLLLKIKLAAWRPIHKLDGFKWKKNQIKILYIFFKEGDLYINK